MDRIDYFNLCNGRQRVGGFFLYEVIEKTAGVSCGPFC